MKVESLIVGVRPDKPANSGGDRQASREKSYLTASITQSFNPNDLSARHHIIAKTTQVSKFVQKCLGWQLRERVIFVAYCEASLNKVITAIGCVLDLN